MNQARFGLRWSATVDGRKVGSLRELSTGDVVATWEFDEFEQHVVRVTIVAPTVLENEEANIFTELPPAVVMDAPLEVEPEKEREKEEEPEGKPKPPVQPWSFGGKN